MIQAFRHIPIDIEANGQPIHVEIPFTIGLLERVEETLFKASGRYWFRQSKRDQNLISAFQEFCGPFLPAELDKSKLSPAFYALFFSHVRKGMVSILDESMISISSTEGQ